MPAVDKEVLSQRTADYQAWVETFARNRRLPIERADTLKNRFTPPMHIDPTITLDAMLAPGDDRERWSQDIGGTVEAYVAEVYEGRVETADCHARDARHRDTHIAIAASPDASAEARTVIAEVTPRWRALMARKGVDWSTVTLVNTICHHWVRMSGWLLFDFEHAGRSQNTAARRGMARYRLGDTSDHVDRVLDRPAGPSCSP